MLKKIIMLFIFMLMSQITNAGQGMFIKINSYLSDTKVSVTNVNCVTGANNIKVNATNYIEANCLFDSKLTLALNQNGTELMKYNINISFNGTSMTSTSPSPHFINGKVIAATLSPHSGWTGSQDWLTISAANAEDDWMKKSGKAIANKSLNAIIIPGSHDTGTQGITPASEITADIDSVLKFFINFDLNKTKHLSNWSKTQNLNIQDQLNLGIRYLDLRVCKSKNNILVTCHSLAGLSVEKILNDAVSFINAKGHEKEILIIDFNHIYNLSQLDIQRLTEMLTLKFGNKIALPNKFTPRSLISEFWKQKKQIILLINTHNTLTHSDIYWNESKIYSPWPDKQDPNDLKKELIKILNSVDKNKRDTLFILQTQETPSAKTIISGFFLSNPDTLLKMTGSYKNAIENWLRENTIKNEMKQKGNIIIEDFTNGIDLTEYAKALN